MNRLKNNRTWHLWYSLIFGTVCNFVVGQIKPLSVGSNTTPSRQAAVTFPSVDTNNTIIGYAKLTDGFTLEGVATTCTYNGLIPVSGGVNLNGGRLILLQDLVLNDSAPSSITCGAITGNGHTVKFASPIRSIEPGSRVRSGCNILTSTDAVATVECVDWSTSNSYLAVATLSGATSGEIAVIYFDGTTLTVTRSIEIGRDAFQVAWSPTNSQYFVASLAQGTNELRSYSINYATMTITETSVIDISRNTVALDFHPTGSLVAVGQTHVGSSDDIRIYDYRLPGYGQLSLVTSIPLATGLNVGLRCISWNPLGNYLAVGSESISASQNELIIFSFNGTTLTNTVSNNVGESITALDWSPSGTFIAVGLSSGTERLRVYKHTVSNGTLSQSLTATVGEANNVLAVHWDSTGNNLQVGSDVVSGSSTSREFAFNKTTETFSLGCTLTYLAASVRTTRYARNDTYFAAGVGNLVYMNNYVFSDPGCALQNVTLLFGDDITCNSSWIFSGTNTIAGRGTLIDFGISGSFILQPNASLLLSNVVLRNPRAGVIRCMDNTATISFDNVFLLLDTDFSFTVGRFDILTDLVVRSTTAFVYRSTARSFIKDRARLLFEAGSTFSYDPLSNSRDLVSLEGASSVLAFDNADLYSSATGLTLTKGKLSIDGRVNVMSDATVSAEGILLGDGVSAANDITMDLLPAVNLRVQRGFLVLRNVT